MKTLIVILLCLLPLTGNAQPYDKVKDELINYVISQKPISFEILNGTIYKCKYYTLTYSDYQFTVVHEFYVPYQQKESWDWNCTRKDGTIVILRSVFPERSVKTETLIKIRDICLQMEKQNKSIPK